MPRYADVRAMGAVAAMVVPEDVARYAYRKGAVRFGSVGRWRGHSQRLKVSAPTVVGSMH
jgi:hypothetical protein